jgi:hypothetical protein
MKKDELFKLAMMSGRYKSKSWIISVFSLLKEYVKNPSTPYSVTIIDNQWKVWDNNVNEFVTIEELDGKPCDINKPIYRFNEELMIDNRVMNYIDHEPVKTTYGRLLVNYILLIYPFGKKIKYINGEIKVKNIEALITPILVDNDSKEANDPSKITVSELNVFSQACGQMEGFTQLCVPAATKKSITTNPLIKERINQLKEEYKDSLNDPVTIAKIDAEVEKLDREWIKGDPSERFFLNDKAFNVSRKKLYGIYGGEAGLNEGGELDFIDKPLAEGIDVTKLPTLANALRSGSYDRGTQTALGGVAVKQFFRIFQNSNIIEKDCGTKVGVSRKIDSINKSRFIGLYQIVNGKPELITEDNINGLIDKTISIRTPATCKTPLTDYCEICMGEENAKNKSGLGASASAIGSNFMILFLKKFHGTSLKTIRLNLLEDIA